MHTLNEIGQTSAVFNTMADRINVLIHDLEKFLSLEEAHALDEAMDRVA